MNTYRLIDPKSIVLTEMNGKKTVPFLDATGVYVWLNTETQEEISSMTNPGPEYTQVFYEVDDENSKTIKIVIDKSAVPEGAKKMYISYMYINDNNQDTPIEPEEPQSDEPIEPEQP